MRVWLKWLFGFGIGLACLSCGRGPAIDLDRTVMAHDESLQITSLKFLGQSPRSNEILVFEMDFDSPKDDLSDGFLEVLINGEESSEGHQPLKPIFLQNETDPHAQAGTIRFFIEIHFPQQDWGYKGAVFEIGIRIRTGTGRVSNTPKVRFCAEH